MFSTAGRVRFIHNIALNNYYEARMEAKETLIGRKRTLASLRVKRLIRWRVGSPMNQGLRQVR